MKDKAQNKKKPLTAVDLQRGVIPLWYLEGHCPRCYFPHFVKHSLHVAECGKCDFKTDDIRLPKLARNFTKSLIGKVV